MNEALVTVFLLNWKRPFNIPHICEALRQQSVPLRIVVWSNESPLSTSWPCEQVVYSSENLICWPRWFMAAQARTRYAMVIDDDLCPLHRDAVASLVACADRHYDEDIIVGMEGVRLRAGCGYFPKDASALCRSDEHLPPHSSAHLRYVERDTRVDVVKGRIMLMKPAVLADLPMAPPYHTYSDDIVVSAHVARRRVHPHVLAPVPPGFFGDMREKDGAMALSNNEQVKSDRELCRQHYYDHI